VADVPDVPLWNPVLFRDRANGLWLFYKVGPTIAAWTGACLRSVDGGRAWSGPHYLPAGLLGPTKNKPITLSSGDILCGSSTETWSAWSCWVEVSDDGGAGWQRFGPISVEDDRGEPRVLPEDFAGVIQPTVWEYAPGRLKMLMRSTARVGRICQATSDDNGRTWTRAVPTDLPNPNSGVDAARLGDGRVALAYNPTGQGRTPLAIALSEDNGVTWPHARVLEAGSGEFSYPSIIQTADALVHLTYTHRRTSIWHAVLSPEWVTAQD
jgi:predicted neuraminidase